MMMDNQAALESCEALQDENSKIRRGFSFYFMKIVWTFFLFSIFGFLLETVWCFFYHGFIESRKSLVIGPFSIIYGIGAVLIILLVDNLKKRENYVVFWIGAITGTAFEYLCSVVQEAVFGTVSWDYSGQVYAIGGRANLIFSLGWGLLSIFALRIVSPLIDKLITFLKNKMGILLTTFIFTFMMVDIFLSATAVLRQGAREDGLEASNAYEIFLDTYYPDETLNKIYVNMRPAGGRLIRDESGHVVK